MAKKKIRTTGSQPVVDGDLEVSGSFKFPAANGNVARLEKKASGRVSVDNKDLAYFEDLQGTATSGAVQAVDQKATQALSSADIAYTEAIARIPVAEKGVPGGVATFDDVQTKVPQTRTINGKALSSNITLAKADVGLGNVPNIDTSTTANISETTDKRFIKDFEVLKLSESLIEVNNLNTLRSLSGSNLNLLISGVTKGVRLLGYTARGDAPIVTYYWNSSSTASDNGGSVIKINSVETGRLILNTPEKIDFRNFGVVGANVSNFSTCMNYAAANSIPLVITKNINLPVGESVIGAIELNFNGGSFVGNDTSISGQENNKSFIRYSQTVITGNYKTSFIYATPNSTYTLNKDFNLTLNVLSLPGHLAKYNLPTNGTTDIAPLLNGLFSELLSSSNWDNTQKKVTILIPRVVAGLYSRDQIQCQLNNVDIYIASDINFDFSWVSLTTETYTIKNGFYFFGGHNIKIIGWGREPVINCNIQNVTGIVEGQGSGGTDTSYSNFSNFVIRAEANNYIEVAGFTLKNGFSNLYVKSQKEFSVHNIKSIDALYDNGINVKNDYIVNNFGDSYGRLYNCYSSGAIDQGFNIDAVNCLIENCVAENCGNSGIYKYNAGGGFGVENLSSTEPKYVNITFLNCKVKNCKNYGFYTLHTGVRWIGCTIDGVTQTEASTHEGANNTIRGGYAFALQQKTYDSISSDLIVGCTVVNAEILLGLIRGTLVPGVRVVKVNDSIINVNTLYASLNTETDIWIDWNNVEYNNINTTSIPASTQTFFSTFINLKYGNTSQRPNTSKIDVGYTYFDTTIGKLIFWNGTTWIDNYTKTEADARYVKKINSAPIEDFGATGDGTADDYLAFTNAANSSYETVLLSDKTYLIDNASGTVSERLAKMLVVKNKRFKGTGNTVIKFTSNELPVMAFMGSNKGGVEGVKFLFAGTTSTVENFTTENIYQRAALPQVHFNPREAWSVIYAAVSDNLVFDNLVFESQTPAVPGSGNGYANGITFCINLKGNGQGNARNKNNRISNCHFSDCIHGALVSGQDNFKAYHLSGIRRFGAEVTPPGHILYMTGEPKQSGGTLNSVNGIIDGVFDYGDAVNLNGWALATLAPKFMDKFTVTNVVSYHPEGLIQSGQGVTNCVFENCTFIKLDTVVPTSPIINFVNAADVSSNNVFRNFTIKSPIFVRVFVNQASDINNFKDNTLDGFNVEMNFSIVAGQNRSEAFNIKGKSNRMYNINITPTAPVSGGDANIFININGALTSGALGAQSSEDNYAQVKCSGRYVDPLHFRSFIITANVQNNRIDFDIPEYVASTAITDKVMTNGNKVTLGLRTVTNFDVEITDATKGVILKSDNGNRWRLKANNDGSPTFTAVT